MDFPIGRNHISSILEDIFLPILVGKVFIKNCLGRDVGLASCIVDVVGGKVINVVPVLITYSISKVRGRIRVSIRIHRLGLIIVVLDIIRVGVNFRIRPSVLGSDSIERRSKVGFRLLL